MSMVAIISAVVADFLPHAISLHKKKPNNTQY